MLDFESYLQVAFAFFDCLPEPIATHLWFAAIEGRIAELVQASIGFPVMPSQLLRLLLVVPPANLQPLFEMNLQLFVPGPTLI